ncbi:retrotransposon protein, putative, ty1-copia subclass [Tanacetum coccineum]
MDSFIVLRIMEFLFLIFIVIYFNDITCDGIYEIDMHDLVPNVSSIYNVSNKRAKRNLDSTYICHYRLGHINKKRIEKLQHHGLLKPTNDESFDKCVSCIFGKMVLGSAHGADKFFESGLISQEASGSNVNLEVIQDIDTQPSTDTSEHQDEEHELGDLNELVNYTAALSDPESDKWVKAMNAKMQSMTDN